MRITGRHPAIKIKKQTDENESFLYISFCPVRSVISIIILRLHKRVSETRPLSFYEPGTTFSDRSGLEATTAMLDRHLRTYWSHLSTRDISVPMNTEYMLSDVAVSGKTDDGNIFADVATRLTPTDGIHDNDVNMISFFGAKPTTVLNMPIPLPALSITYPIWIRLLNRNSWDGLISTGLSDTWRFASSLKMYPW